MSDTELLAKMGTDAAKWATEYEERFPDETPDWGTLVGWFANAIEVVLTNADRSILQAPQVGYCTTHRLSIHWDKRWASAPVDCYMGVVKKEKCRVISALLIALAFDPPGDTK